MMMHLQRPRRKLEFLSALTIRLSKPATCIAFRTLAILPLLARMAAAEILITGRVVDETGARVHRAHVAVRSADQTSVATVESAPDGTFRIVSRSGFSTVRLAIDARDNNAVEVVVPLTVQPLGTQVAVTAETGRVSSSDSVPQRVNVIPQSIPVSHKIGK